MPYLRTATAVLVSLTLTGSSAFASSDAPQKAQAVTELLETLLEDGLVRRVPFSQVSQTVRQARSALPESPIPDYAHGLVLLGRIQTDKAVSRFAAALEREPTYLPAWKALLRTRLVRQQTKSFQDESLKLAKLAGTKVSVWQSEEQRKDAAVWLGRTIGFLSLPECDVLEPQELSRLEAELKSHLGDDLAADFGLGRDGLLEDRQQLEQSLKKEFAQESARREKKANDDLEDLTDREEELEDKAETLELTADQWKDWLDEAQKKSDQKLKDLQKQYATLDEAGQKISQLIQQTQVSVGRFQTQLAFRGIRGVQADQQPGMIQLRRELSQYQSQYQALEQRATGLVLQGRQVAAGQAAAILRYQQATGKIGRESATLTRWKKSVEKESAKLGNQDHQALEAKFQRRLSQVASYFELDAKTELKRLIEQAEGAPEAN